MPQLKKSAACPLCGYGGTRSSWLGSVWYRGREFPYVECARCGSLFCDPMPDEALLRIMYGPEYTQEAGGLHVEDPKEPKHVLEILARQQAGIFVDYGCGNGELLVAAKRMGWQAVGVELDAEVAHKTQANTGCPIFTDPNNAADCPQADVLHLGDVIEHLTKLDEQFPEILALLKPGGLLLAQGPLENNASLFTFVVASARKLRPSRRTEMAPYHVLLATSQGQRDFFRRFGLEEVEYKLREVSWPAPVGLALSDVKNPKTVATFALRRLSQAVSALRPSKWGNRYFYAGRKT